MQGLSVLLRNLCEGQRLKTQTRNSIESQWMYQKCHIKPMLHTCRKPMVTSEIGHMRTGWPIYSGVCSRYLIFPCSFQALHSACSVECVMKTEMSVMVGVCFWVNIDRSVLNKQHGWRQARRCFSSCVVSALLQLHRFLPVASSKPMLHTFRGY